jgi:hypothetical protein
MLLSCRRRNPLAEVTAAPGSTRDAIARGCERGAPEGTGDEVACTGTAICSTRVRLPTCDDPGQSPSRACVVLVPRALLPCTTPDRLPAFPRKNSSYRRDRADRQALPNQRMNAWNLLAAPPTLVVVVSPRIGRNTFHAALNRGPRGPLGSSMLVPPSSRRTSARRRSRAATLRRSRPRRAADSQPRQAWKQTCIQRPRMPVPGLRRWRESGEIHPIAAPRATRPSLWHGG